MTAAVQETADPTNEAIARIVAAAPPLSADQVSQLGLLLSTGADS